MVNTFEFSGELWRYTGKAAWYFVTLPHEVADDIEKFLRSVLAHKENA